MISNAVELGDKVEVIRKTGFKSNQQSLFSKIQEIPDSNVLIISAPIENGKIIPLEINWEYYVCIYTSRGLYRCEAEVIERKHYDNIFLAKLQVKTKMQKYQRRQYYRLDCVLSFHYKDQEDDIWTQGIILDISGGGIRYSNNIQMRTGEQLVCHIQLNFEEEQQKHVYINGTIVSSSIIDLAQYIYETRIAFDHITNEDREVIIRFIFEEERKRRKREKGM